MKIILYLDILLESSKTFGLFKRHVIGMRYKCEINLNIL